jgi:hypothetical protein
LKSFCSEPLVWICRSCDHSFHAEEWTTAGKKCPACETREGQWRCSLCQEFFYQPVIGATHPCLKKVSHISPLFFDSENKTKARLWYGTSILVALIIVYAIILVFAPSEPSPALPKETRTTNSRGATSQTESAAATEEQVCSEGLVRGIVYDPDGPIKLREEPRADAKILKQIPSGSAVVFRDGIGEWKETFVDDSETTFYVHENRLLAEARNIDTETPTKIRGGQGFDTAVVGEVGIEVPFFAQFDDKQWLFVVVGSSEMGFVHGYVWHELIQDPRLSR